MLTNALDPTFSLSSDFYYRSLLAKVFDWESNMLSFPLLSQIYEKGRVTIRQYLENEKPEFASIALDGWSIHSHGYVGAISSTFV